MAYIWGVREEERGRLVCEQEGAMFLWYVEPSYILKAYGGMLDEDILFITEKGRLPSKEDAAVSFEFLWTLANSRGTIQDYPEVK